MVQASSDAGDGKRPPWYAPGRLSLRTRLLLLVVACVVPLLAFSLGGQYLQYREAVAATGRQTLELVRSMSLVVEQELRARMVALEVLALSPTLHRDDFAAFRAEAEAVIEQQFPVSNLIILKEDGQQLMNTLLPPGTSLPVPRTWRRPGRSSPPGGRQSPISISARSGRGPWLPSTSR